MHKLIIYNKYRKVNNNNGNENYNLINLTKYYPLNHFKN
jgi:hypothetical protein